MSDLLRVQSLNVEYYLEGREPTRALKDVSFAIGYGETVGLMGESGCGKTTLASAVLGLLPRERTRISGSIRFCGDEIMGMRENKLRQIRGSGIAIVHQEPELALSPFLRAGEQVAEVVRAHRQWNRNQCREAASAALKRMGFAEPERIYHSFPHQLSGGQRQRVVFAQALVCEPALIVADEPTASLDARTQAEIIALLLDIKKARQVSLLLISHTPEVQASLADRLMVMSEGRLIEEGSFDQLYWHPAQELTKAMLHSKSGMRERRRDANSSSGTAWTEAHEEFVK